MPEKIFSYKETHSRIFGKVNRPLIDIRFYSEITNRFILVPDVLIDSGADVSLLPRDFGEMLLLDYTKGKRFELQGISPEKLSVYLHRFKVRINGIEFTCPVAIADSPNVPPLLGRVEALDLFVVTFSKGLEIKIRT